MSIGLGAAEGDKALIPSDIGINGHNSPRE